MGTASGQEARGQVIVVVALLLAVVFVALAVILNSAIYAENLSTRETADSIEASGAVSEAADDVEAAIRRVNADADRSHEVLGTNLTAIVDARANASTDRHAVRGAAYSLSLVGTTNGTQIRQNTSRAFTNETGSGSWNLTEDAENVRDFRLNVSRDTLEETNESGLGADDPFYVYAHNGSGEWRAYVYRDDETGDVNVTVEADGEIQRTCRVADVETARIDLTAGTLEGTPCETLALSEWKEDEWEAVGYRNVDAGEENVTGTYGLVVRDATIPDGYAEAPDSPFTADAIYDAEIEVAYVRSDITHNRTVRVVPGAEA